MDQVPADMKDAAVWYATKGWGIVPISVYAKIPLIKRWTEYPLTDPQAVSAFYERKQCNIGIVAGFSGLACVDCDGEEGLAAFFGLIDQNGGEIGDPWIASTPGGGKHFVYRHPGNAIKVKSRSKRHDLPIDVKADGGQFLVEPSMSKSGRQYRWETPPLAPQPGDLPPWLLAWVVEDDTAEEKERKKTRANKTGATRVYAGPPVDAGDKLKNFLARLENCRQRGENHWMACCPAHESKGRNSLSVMAGTLQPIVVHCFAGCEAESIFKAVGLSIFDACMESQNDLLPNIDSIAAAMMSESVELAVRQRDCDDPGELPEAVLDGHDGILTDVVEWNRRTARCWQPEFALAGALTLVATVTGRKVEDEEGTRTNIYTISVAVAGAGKDHARKVNKKAFTDIGAEEFLATDDIASGSGLASLLDEFPTRLAQIDEVGDLLASIRAGGAKMRHLAMIETNLKEIYSSSDSVWSPGGYADTKKNKTIRNPHYVLHGTGSPDKFWDSITPSNIGDGVLPRMMIFCGKVVRLSSKFDKLNCCPPEIAAALQAWVKWQPNAGMLQQMVPNLATAITVPIDSQAKERLKRHEMEISERRIGEDSIKAAVWGRTAEKSQKLALLFACSRIRDPSVGGLVIRLDDAERAILLSNWLTRRMIFQVWGRVGSNDRERNLKRFLELTRVPISTRDFMRRTQSVSKRERSELLSELVERGDIVIVEESSSTAGGRPRKVIKSMSCQGYDKTMTKP